MKKIKSWNKGLTKETDKRVKKYGINSGNSRKGKPPWNKNKKTGKIKDEIKNSKKYLIRNKKISINKKGKKFTKEQRKSYKNYWKSLKTKMKGEKNPSWKGGVKYEEYGYSWTTELKKETRKRDKWQCQICLCKNKKLIVHHIDMNKKNCNLNNLITLCQSCHGKIHYNESEFWVNKRKELMQ